MSSVFEICPGRKVGEGQPCFIIAEIGQNHQGDIKIAKEMIKMAKDCGADCAKFQKSELEHKFNKEALARPYNSEHSWGATYGDHKRFLEFSHDEFRELKRYAEEDVGICFTASAMDLKAIDFLLDDLKVPFLKVPSNDTNSVAYLTHAAKKGKPMVVSTGMCDLPTVRKAYETVKSFNSEFCVLQCTSTYPLRPSDVHLKCIELYQREFPDIPIGYSGHEDGIFISIAAVACGAKVLERHVTLDKSWKGSDHKASLNPEELKQLVDGIREVEAALGKPLKAIRASEEACRGKLGKSLVATKDLQAGDVLEESMLIVKVAEPHGVRPQWLCNVVGRKLLRDIAEDATLLNEDVEGWQDPEKCLSLNGDAVSKDVAVSNSDGVEISDGQGVVKVGSA